MRRHARLPETHHSLETLQLVIGIEVSGWNGRSLSKSWQWQRKLFDERDQGRSTYRIVNPLSQ